MAEESFIIKNKNIKPNNTFFQRQEKLYQMNGWFSPGSHGIFDSLLCYQKEKGVKGNLGEIGVWHGKSATVLCHNSLEGETVTLIDPYLKEKENYIFRNIGEVCGEVSDFIKVYNEFSENLLNSPILAEYFNSYRFFHIDGCHTGTNVFHDIELAEKLVHEKAVLVVDDFMNPSYPQITEAVYRYLFLHPYNFKLFLAGFNKAYLCRNPSYSFYYEFCMEKLQKEMLSRGMAIAIKKTSGIGDCDTISIEDYKPQEDPLNGLRGPDWDPNSFDIVKKEKLL